MTVVINIHEVNDPVWFEKFILSLRKEFRFAAFSDLISDQTKGTSNENLCHITVDDGDKTYYNVIFPVLKKYNIQSTVFLSPDILLNHGNFWFQEIVDFNDENMLRIIDDVKNSKIGDLKNFPVVHILKCLSIDTVWEIIGRYRQKHNREEKAGQNMNIGELKEIYRTGLVNCGAHTMRHPILANEVEYISRQEIKDSIIGLSDILEEKIDCFAYPNGEPDLDYGEREISILRDTDCKYAFSTKPGNFSNDSYLYSIPRFGSSTGDSKKYLKLKILTGSLWGRIMRMKPGNEFANRKSIREILDN
jgi:peptidoglycan/xylan/chitin deacetylase (PgdA/CDA1 family)